MTDFSIKDVIRTRLLKNSAIYFSAIGINSLISFLLVPILTRYLSPTDYGIISTIQIAISILGIFICMGIENSIPVNYFKLNSDQFAGYIKNVIVVMMFNFIIMFSIMYLAKAQLATFLQVPVFWIISAVLSISVTPFISVAIMLLIVEEKVMSRSVIVILQTVIGAVLSLFFIVFLNMDWRGRLLGIIVTSFIFGIVGLFIIRKRLNNSGTGLNAAYMKDALKFGIPLIPYALSGQIMYGVNRFFINSMLDVAQTGIYAVAFQMGMIVSYIGSSFNTVWMPFFYEKLKEGTGHTKLKIVKMTYAICIGILLAAVCWGLGSPFILKYLLGKDFHQASKYVIWIAMAFGFESIYSIISGYLFYSKKTYLLTMIGVISALANIILTYALIKLNGLTGAAQATFLTYLIFALLAWKLSSKVYKMPWDLRASND